jgi:hypothetical protein
MYIYKHSRDTQAAKAKEREAALYFVPETEEEDARVTPAGAGLAREPEAVGVAPASVAVAAVGMEVDSSGPLSGVAVPQLVPAAAPAPPKSIHRLEADVGAGARPVLSFYTLKSSFGCTVLFIGY